MGDTESFDGVLPDPSLSDTEKAIPEDVLDQAARRLWDVDIDSPDVEWDALATSFKAALRTQVEAAMVPVTEWARLAALEEAETFTEYGVDVINDDEFEPDVVWISEEQCDPEERLHLIPGARLVERKVHYGPWRSSSPEGSTE